MEALVQKGNSEIGQPAQWRNPTLAITPESNLQRQSLHCPTCVPIPQPDRARLYRVAVVNLSSDFNDTKQPVPFLKMSSDVTSNQPLIESASPFVVGDVAHESEFVHVMDVAGLWAVLSTVDTVTDFARYLDARCAFIRGKAANTSDSEWCVLTRYLFSFDEDGECIALDHANPGTTHLANAEWQSEQTRIALTARHRANRESYLWDSLIEYQAQMIEHQSFAFSTYNSVEEAERVVRHMALEDRLNRRVLSQRWKEVCLQATPGFAARIRTVPHSKRDGTTYVFLNVSNFMNEPYETYRAKRRAFLQKMMLASLVDVPSSNVVIGIAAEYGSAPDSYDLAHFDVDANADQSLEREAHEAWLLKKSAFESLGTSISR